MKSQSRAEMSLYSFFNLGYRWGLDGQIRAPAASLPGKDLIDIIQGLEGPQSNTIFKIKPKLYIASRSGPPLPLPACSEKFWICIQFSLLHHVD